MTMMFRGAKGSSSGGKSKSPVQMPDTLRSADTIEVVLALGEGPLKGLVDGSKSFLVGDTALENQSGESNFDGFTLEFLPGALPNETITPILGGLASSYTVSTKLAQNVAVIRTGSVKFINFLEIRLVFQQLLTQGGDGSSSDGFTDISFEYKASSSGTWLQAFPDLSLHITGKTTESYLKEVRFPVPSVNDTYDIRLIKLDVDNSTTNLVNVSWESTQEVVAEDTFSFPGTSLIHLTGKATAQFSSLPDFSGIYDCRIISVPSNYDPVARTYTGIWDGTFVKAYTNNNAWVLYDFVTNDTFGMNAYYPITLDKWDAYEAAQWCDQMVSDGKGGLQPRFTFNFNITDATSATELCTYIAGTFNAITFDDGNGTLHLRVDKPDAAVALFTVEDVIDGDFQYAFTDITTRFNEITYSFVNPDLDWKEDRRTVPDLDHIAKYGRIPTDFIAVGCNDVQEGARRTRYKLKTGITETTSVTFSTNRQGQYISPFEIILISDETLGYSLSGKINTVNSATQFTCRDPIFLETGISYLISVQIPDVNYPTTSDFPYTLVEVAIDASTGAGYRTVFNTVTALPSGLPANASFSIQQADGQGIGLPKPFRVMRVTEVDGSPDNIQILAIEVNRDKWPYVDEAQDVGELNYSKLGSINTVPGPSDVKFYESFDRFTTSFLLKIVPVLNKKLYKFYTTDFEVWSRPVGDVSFISRTTTPDGTIVNHPAGDYEFRVCPKNFFGITADVGGVSTFAFSVTNPSDPPPDVDWALTNGLNLIWGYSSPPIDLAGFLVRYRTDNGIAWEDAQVGHVGFVSASPYDLSNIPQSATTILIKAVDWFDIESDNAVVLKPNLDVIQAENVIFSYDFAALGFIGTETNSAVVGGDLVAVSDGTLKYTAPSNPMYSSPANDFYSSSYLALGYEEQVLIPFDGNLKSHYTFIGDSPVFEYQRLGSGPMYSGGAMYSGSSVHMYVSADPWIPMSANQPIVAGLYGFRVSIAAGIVPAQVNDLAITIDLPDIEETVAGMPVANTGSRVPITKTYQVIKSVHPTVLYDGGTGFVAIPIDKLATGPLIEVRNNVNVATTGHIDVIIKGY